MMYTKVVSKYKTIMTADLALLVFTIVLIV